MYGGKMKINTLYKKFQFKDFSAAFAFMDKGGISSRKKRDQSDPRWPMFTTL
jgi:pterin-4a-carbinolamine dehydratase